MRRQAGAATARTTNQAHLGERIRDDRGPWCHVRPGMSRSAPVRMMVGAFALVLCAWNATLLAQVIYSQGQAIELERASDTVLVEMDGTVDRGTLAQSLAQAGFTTISDFEHVPARAGYLQVPVIDAGAATLAMLEAVPGVKAARQVYNASGLSAPLVPTGQIIARFTPGTPGHVVDAKAAQFGCVVARAIQGLTQTYVLTLTETTRGDTFDVAAQLYQDSATVWCHPDLYIKTEKQAVEIDDPYFNYQWHLENTAQYPGSVRGADISVRDAWEHTEGGGAIVAVIDDAVNWEHEDLIANYRIGRDFVDEDGDPNPDAEGENHGTAVTGLICARGNEIGVRGVAPQAQFIACRALYGTTTAMADAFLFCERNGAMVINNSWGLVFDDESIFPGFPPTPFLPDVLVDAIEEVATEGRSGRGVLVMFSSANSSGLVAFDNALAALSTTMAVGATMRNDRLSCYSSFGPEQSIVAPGGGVDFLSNCFEADIATTDVMDSLGLPTVGYNPEMAVFYREFQVVDDEGNPVVDDEGNPVTELGRIEFEDPNPEEIPDRNYTRFFNGTSAACPVASGVAALVFSVNSSYTAEEVRNLLEHTADKVDDVNVYFDAVTGHSDFYGHGRANAARAVEAARDGLSWPSPITGLQIAGVQDEALLTWTNPDNNVAGVLVARGELGRLNWAPQDGIEYTVGQQVAPGVSIVADGLIEELQQPGLSTADYEYAIFVRNPSNYYSWGRRTRFSATSGTPTIAASISATPDAGTAPLMVHFAGGVIDEHDPKSVTFNWDFGDGNVGSGDVIDHTYSASGEYLVRLTAVNELGRAAESTKLIVVSAEASDPPQVQMGASPTSGQAPLVVLFQAEGTDPDGTVIRYDWDFGDGDRAGGQIIEHTYLDAGTYAPTVTVTDNSGRQAVASLVIRVSGASVTAADTEPTGALGAGPLCGAGAPVAAIGTLTVLLSLMMVRNRRR